MMMEKKAEGGIAMNYKLITTLVVLGLVVLFIVQNVAVVEIKFLFWSFSMSRSLLLFIVLALGILTGWLMKSFSGHKK
jgi:uncharacterized integral membrane protein